MAVAVKNASEAVSPSALDRLAVSSLLGVLYVLGSIGIVFYAIPTLWGDSLSGAHAFVYAGLMVLVMAIAGGGLGYLGVKLLGPHPHPGVRAGIGIGILGLLAIVFLTWAFGAILQAIIGADRPIGGLITAVFGLGLLYGLGRIFFRASFEETLAAVEDQGWFSWNVYKGSQGQRVRRGTMLGILILVACGIYTLLAHHTLEAGDPNWTMRVPFTDVALTLLRDVRFTIPLILTAGGLWLAFRIVNFPAFADFLIATEAEMNKVSWSTRKRIWQDTVVVLTTLVLMTLFLMVVDLFWGWALTRVHVLQIQDTSSVEKKQAGPKW